MITTAVIIPVGPGAYTALDTLDSVSHYCREPHEVVIIDDCTSDGTYEALTSARRANWSILRNPRPMGIHNLVWTLTAGFRFALEQTSCQLVLRLDQDALIIKPDVISDALVYMSAHPSSGMFGVYEVDYDRPRSLSSHKRLIEKETSWLRRRLGLAPYWTGLLARAEGRGYRRGDNVFGGAYFLTRDCLQGMFALGALDVPDRTRSKLMEDVYFSMAAVAAGFNLGHFAAPDGPLCLEWRGLPLSARDLAASPFKLVHSVDKGKNTDALSNEGRTAREVFRAMRSEVQPR